MLLRFILRVADIQLNGTEVRQGLDRSRGCQPVVRSYSALSRVLYSAQGGTRSLVLRCLGTLLWRNYNLRPIPYTLLWRKYKVRPIF